jgi:hypothetical protein
MALTKEQEYPLYFLLVTESSLIQNLRGGTYADSAAFLTALQRELQSMDPGIVLDAGDQIGNLYRGSDPISGNAIIAQEPATVLGVLPGLAGIYGGGPCPRTAVNEQQAVWNALSAVQGALPAAPVAAAHAVGAVAGE